MSFIDVTYLTFNLINLLLMAAAVVLVLRIVWRVEKKLDKFFKILMSAIVILFLRSFIHTLQHLLIWDIGELIHVFDLAVAVYLIYALAIMNSIIIHLNRER